MRIIGNVRGDYYDGLQHDFFSHEPLYIRNEIYEHQKDNEILGFNDIKSERYGISVGHGRGMILGFCGKIYPFIQIVDRVTVKQIHNRQTFNTDIEVETYCYSLDDYIKWADKNKINIDRKKWGRTTKQYTARWFDAAKTRDKFCNKFFSYEHPIFIIESSGYSEICITYNPRLKDYQFYHVYDAYKTWQELEMFLSNQAAPEKPIPTIDDLTLAYAKGYDKYSFRKEKKNG